MVVHRDMANRAHPRKTPWQPCYDVFAEVVSAEVFASSRFPLLPGFFCGPGLPFRLFWSLLFFSCQVFCRIPSTAAFLLNFCFYFVFLIVISSVSIPFFLILFVLFSVCFCLFFVSPVFLSFFLLLFLSWFSVFFGVFLILFRFSTFRLFQHFRRGDWAAWSAPKRWLGLRDGGPITADGEIEFLFCLCIAQVEFLRRLRNIHP